MSSADNQIEFKNLMIRSRLCNFSDAYILFQRTITVPNRGTAAAPNNRNKKAIFKNSVPFNDSIRSILYA